MRRHSVHRAGLLVLVLLAWLCPLASSVVVPANFTGRLDAFVKCAMTTLGPPALRPPELIMAVVANGQTLLAEGYGRDASGNAITAHTLMGIGSCSKAFTSTLMGLMFAKQKLSPNTPVAELPRTSLRTYSSYIDSHATLRDLLTHNTGISRADYLAILYNGTASSAGPAMDWRAFVSSRVRSLPPVVDFREHYRYNNYIVAAAAAVLQDVDGTRPWEDMLQDDLLTPLGMADTISSSVQAKLSGKAATPYTRGYSNADPPRQLPADVDDWADLIKPAGSIFSSATDMAQWLKLHTGHGPTTIPLPAEYLDYLHTAQVLVDPPQAVWSSTLTQNRSSVSLGYAYGWGEVDSNGHRVVTHSGALLGFWTEVDVWPLDDFGVFISTPAVSFDTIAIIDAWVELELLGMDNFVARALCTQGRDAQGWEERVTPEHRAQVHDAIRRHTQRARLETVMPSQVLPEDAPARAALSAAVAGTDAAQATPEQIAGVYYDRRSLAWGSLELTATGNASWPLQLVFESWVSLMRPSSQAPYWDGLILAPAAFLVLNTNAQGMMYVNASADGTVHGVYLLLDDPTPYFTPGSGPTPGPSSTGGAAGSSSGGGTGGGGEPASTSSASTVLLTIALALVSVGLLLVVGYAVFITKRYRDLRSDSFEPSSNLRAPLM